MKKLIAILVCLSMVLGVLPVTLAEPALAPETAEDNTAALPEVGNVVNGFEALETREFPLIGAQVVLFEHQKTGAKLMYIANDDTNRVFDLTFMTDAIDKTGLPHVFEHSTLDGSEKYPSKALFFNLIYQTYNTYMNAFTMDRMTSYPIASLSEAQLLKYADYYTDSCLHPMILEDESIYREEAWRYRLPDADAELTIEGTVYSEMMGAMDLEGTASINNLMTAFPGSMIGNEYGGDPEYIPDMTWEMLKDYHDRYYHPSNCIAFLYGEFEDYTAFLKLLDEAFAPYEKREFTREDAEYKPLTEPVEAAYAFPVETGSGTEHASVVYYTIVCPGADEAQQHVLNTLTDLMSADASVVQQDLKKALPYGSFSCYIETGSPDPAIVFSATNVNPDDAHVVRDTIDGALAEIAENGFPQEMVDGVMASLSIETKLMRESSNVGVENIIPNVAYSYVVSGTPWNYMDYIDAMGMMDERNQQGVYAEAVAQWLIDSNTTALVTTYPEPGLKEQKDAELAAKLAQTKADMSEEEIASLVEATNAEEEEEDTSIYVNQLQAVTVASLPEEIKEYDIRDEVDERGVRHIDAVAAVDGIGQVGLFLNAMGLEQEALHWFKLYTDLTGELDTRTHTRSELATLSGRYLNSENIYVSLPDNGEDDYSVYMRLSWIAQDEDLAMGYDLMRELIFDLKVEDSQKVLEAVRAFKARLKSSITSAPYNAMLYRSMGRFGEKWTVYDYINNLAYYSFLEQTEQLLIENPDLAVEKLQFIQNYFDNRNGAVALYAGSEEGIAVNRELTDSFMDSLNDTPIERKAYSIDKAQDAEALIVDGSVSFNGLVASYEDLGIDEYDAGLDAVTSLVTDSFLYPLLRDQYGAYGVFHAAMSDGGVYVISYRDPNVAQTFEVYDQLPELVASLEPDQATLDGYILSAYSGYAAPQGELSGAISAATNALEGKPQDEALEWMRQLKAVTPETFARYASMYQGMIENGVLFTAGAASAVNANADLYETVLNPFGTVDATQVSFEDLAEDHPNYAAVRFAFENNLMLPLEEGAFGVDAPTTNGDLMASLYALAGGTPDADEALEFFVGYGLADADTDLQAPAAVEDVFALISAMVGEEVPATIEAETLTRGEYAQILMDLFNA